MRFYARGYRRLLRAAFVALVVSSAAVVFVASAAEVSDSKGAFRAAFLYFANWHFIQQGSDYFAADIDRSPVIHFWSLAVEEQFYLLWPLLLGGMVALGALASVIAALHISTTDLNRAYYGTDTRAYQLLAGALLALTPRLFRLGERARRGLEIVAVAALLAIILLATSAINLETIHRGVAITIATCVLIIAIENARTSAVAKGLSQPVAAYLGRLSYGIYLWHWPVIFVLTRKTSLGPIGIFAVTCVVATALAATSYHYVEFGIRRSPRLDRYPLQIIAAGLTLSLLGGLVVVPAILNQKHASVLKATNSVEPTKLDWRAAKSTSPQFRIVRSRRLPPAPSFTARARTSSSSATATPACTSLRSRKLPRTRTSRSRSRCIRIVPGNETSTTPTRVRRPARRNRRTGYGGLVDVLDPDVIVVANRPIDDPAAPIGLNTPVGTLKPVSKRVTPEMRVLTKESIPFLRKGGRKVVVIDPIPVATGAESPLNCLSSATEADQCIY